MNKQQEKTLVEKVIRPLVKKVLREEYSIGNFKYDITKLCQKAISEHDTPKVVQILKELIEKYNY